MDTKKSRFRTKSEHSLDSKGRLNFPSRFRDVLARYGDQTLILVILKKSHLRAYPISEWEIIEDRLVDQGRERRGFDRFVRQILASVTECTLDKQGRILLPSTLRAEIRIGKDVVLNGMRDFVEVWDKDAWASEMELTPADSDDFDEGLSKLGIL